MKSSSSYLMPTTRVEAIVMALVGVVFLIPNASDGFRPTINILSHPRWTHHRRIPNFYEVSITSNAAAATPGDIDVSNAPLPRRQNEKDKAIARNVKISNLGRIGKWKEMLQLYQEEKDSFNNVNYSTMASQLGKIWAVDRRSPTFLSFIDELAIQIEKRGLRWMQVRETANVLYAIGKMKLRCRGSSQIMDLVSKPENAKWYVTEGNTYDIANGAWAFARLGIKSPRLFAEIEENAEWFVAEAKPQAISNTAWACAKLGFESPNLFHEIDKRTESLIEEGKPQAIANIAWACGKLGIKMPKLFSEIEKDAARLIHEGQPQAVANTVVACAKLDVKLPMLFAEIENNADWLVKAGNTQAVANTAWAFGKIGFKSLNLIAEIEKRAEWLVAKGTTQNVANTAWAFATLGIEAPKLFAEIDGRANWLVRAGRPQEISNTAWACATLGYEAPTLFAEIEKRAEWLVTKGKPQAVSNTILACAKLDKKPPMLVAEIEKRANWLVSEGSHQAVANTAWAVATLGMKSPVLFSEIEKRAEWLVKDGNPLDVANTLWAASRFKYYTPKLLTETDLHSKWLVKEGDTQNTANVALTFATMDYNATSFFAALEDNIDKLLDDRNSQAICNICYSLVILDLGNKYVKLLSSLWNKAMEMDLEYLTNEGLNQLAQVKAYAMLDRIDLVDPPPTLRIRMNNAEQDTPSQFSYQKEVSSCLAEMDFTHEEEVSPLDEGGNHGILSIDMASRKQKVAIEYDGPSHFLVSLPSGEVTRKEDGQTKSKRRFLERLGWKVINLDYRDDKGKGKQTEWLQKELAKVGMQ